MATTELDKIKQRCGTAYKAGHYAECARLAAQGAALAERLGDAEWRVRMRTWEGESRWQNKEVDAAVAALTEAADDASGVDPQDSFNAVSTLLSIAVEKRPAAEARQLLVRGHRLLERGGRTASRHMLDLNEGNLAARRGDWNTALDHYRIAYERQRGDRGMPRFTEASYLIKLAEAYFMLGDGAGLQQQREAINNAKMEVEGDHLRAEQMRMLCHRAGLEEPTGAKTDACGAARRLLRWLEEFEGYRTDYARDALLVLLLHGDWLSVETWIEYPGIGDDPFIAGDLHWARARAGLGLPLRDPVWQAESSPTSDSRMVTDHQRDRVTAELAAARVHYQSKRAWAAAEDARFETDYYIRVIEQRLGWIAELEHRYP